MNDDDLDLGPLLRGRGEELPAPAGAWESIARRGRRRRRAKTVLAVAAGVVLVAGATPVVLALNHSSDDQRLQVSADRHSAPAPINPLESSTTVHPSLAKLLPASISFVSPTEGWVSGELQVLGGTVAGGLGRTEDAGATWSIEVANPAPQGTVRFADSEQGFSFGTTYQMTRDGGKSWQTLPSPGYIADLETFHGVVWALVRSCVPCQGLRLYQATLTAPNLVRVAAVKPIGDYDAALTLHGHAIYATGGDTMWATTDDGYSWRHEDNPCGGGDQAFATWSDTGLAAECTPTRGVGSIFESLDAGRHWTNIADVPRVRASVGTLSAGSPDNLIVTTGVGPPYVTHHHGHQWARAGVEGAVGFAAFISTTHIVGITAGPNPAFVASENSGHTWSETPFRRRPPVIYGSE